MSKEKQQYRMNGAATREGYGYNAGRLSPPTDSLIPGKTLVEGYRKDIVNGFEKEKPRYNPVRIANPMS